MKVKIKRKKHFKISYIIVLITIILLFIGTSYSLLNTTLYINGNIDGDFNCALEPVPVGSNYSSNTGFTATGFLSVRRTIMEFVRDVKTDSMLTTEIRNDDKFTVLSPGTHDTTFTITLKNNSPLKLTNGTAVISDDQSGQYMNTSGKPTLGSTTLNANGTTTVKVTLSFDKQNKIPANSYVTYTISYKYNSLTISYKYRILVVN